MSALHDGRALANGIEQHYWRAGGGPPVLLLHGLTDSGACWARLARELVADYDLIMPDARGHGRSAAPDAGYSPEDRAADVVALIDALGLDRPVLVGHSMGGLTAALVAADAPGRIGGAILEDPSFLTPEEWADPQRQTWPAQHARDQALGAAELVARGRAEHPHWPDDVLAPWAEAKGATSVKAFDWLGLPATDFRAVVARIAVPTLLVTSETALGARVSAAVADELRAASPLLRVAHVAGAGHCIRYDRPEEFAGLVRGFLAERAAER